MWRFVGLVLVGCGSVPEVEEAAVEEGRGDRRPASVPVARVEAEPADGAYALPFPAGTVVRVGQGYHGTFSHVGTEAFALDFPVPEGTPVTAARGGVVWSVADDSDEGCPDPACAALVNVIVIDHGDGTFGSYHHLAHGSARVSVGDPVARGERLASSGATGRTTAPHLHFQVRDAWGTTLPVRFRELEASGGAAYAGADLVSGNVPAAVPPSGAWSTCARDTFAFVGVTLEEGAPCSVAEERVTVFEGRIWVRGAVPVLTVLDDAGFHVVCGDEPAAAPGAPFSLAVDWDALGVEGEVAYTVSAGRPGTCAPFQPTSAAIALQVW